jgi:predicted Zn-dependent peptidase
METAAGALTRSLPLRFETGGKIVSRLTEEIVFGLSADYWQNFPACIEAVSGEEARDISSRLFDPAGLAVLVVGDAEAVRSGLEGIGPVRLAEAP